MIMNFLMECLIKMIKKQYHLKFYAELKHPNHNDHHRQVNHNPGVPHQEGDRVDQILMECPIQ